MASMLALRREFHAVTPVFGMRGTENWNTVRPGLYSTNSKVPLCSSAMRREIASPSPAPLV